MPIDPKWIPAGWTACTPSCTSPQRDTEDGKNDVYCDCVDACLNVGRCGCRLVRRKKVERDPNEPDGWKLGDVEMVKETCEERAPYDHTYMYKCLCLEKQRDEKAEREQQMKR